MSQDKRMAEQHATRARSRHAGRRRWITYAGYTAAGVGLACLVVHLFAGWKLVRIDAMLPTYLWIVTGVLLVLGAGLVLANEGLGGLSGSEEVAFGQIVGEPAQAGDPAKTGGPGRERNQPRKERG